MTTLTGSTQPVSSWLLPSDVHKPGRAGVYQRHSDALKVPLAHNKSGAKTNAIAIITTIRSTHPNTNLISTQSSPRTPANITMADNPGQEKCKHVLSSMFEEDLEKSTLKEMVDLAESIRKTMVARGFLCFVIPSVISDIDEEVVDSSEQDDGERNARASTTRWAITVRCYPQQGHNKNACDRCFNYNRTPTAQQ